FYSINNESYKCMGGNVILDTHDLVYVSEKLDRLKKDNIEYIRSIIDIIVILHNMKSKYLKSKIPLPAPLIRSLKKPEKIIEVLEVPPSKWFEELQIKIFNTTDAKDADVNSALMQLGRFSQMGVRTVPHCRARLCLLVMSMPAYDLCKISMQLAIRFVLEEILTGQAEEY
ncbi:uncharacterized protein LOC126817845, partial [Patella vulgata]|uniref:uncharacterized protein LOC126817845 n=1 Tax=Patella vulgata TaxID=6465 RepID=UPI00217F42B5